MMGPGVYIEITQPSPALGLSWQREGPYTVCLQKAGAVALALQPANPPPRPQHSPLLNGVLLILLLGLPCGVAEAEVPDSHLSLSWCSGEWVGWDR